MGGDDHPGVLDVGQVPAITARWLETRPSSATRLTGSVGAKKTVNRGLGGQRQGPGGPEGRVTNLAGCPDGTPVTAEFVIGAYRRLFQIEKPPRMSEHELQARPVCQRGRGSDGAHLTIAFAALAVSGWIEEATGGTIGRRIHQRPRAR